MINETAKTLLREVQNTLEMRGKEYQTQESEFQYFEDIGKVMNLKVEDTILFMMALKLTRIKVQLKMGKATTDSVVDLIGYAVILQAWLSQSKPTDTYLQVKELDGVKYGRISDDNIRYEMSSGYNGERTYVCLGCNIEFRDAYSAEFHLCNKIWKKL